MTEFVTQKGVAVPTYSDISGGTATLPNGSTATTQAALDNSTKVATTAYTDSAVTAGGSTDTVKANGVVVVTPFSFTALVNGIGPVGETEVNTALAANNTPCMYENTGVLLAGLRVVGSTYYNSTAYPMLVAVTLNNTSANIIFTAFADTSVAPSTVVAKGIQSGATGFNGSEVLLFFVLSGQFYKITGSGGTSTVQSWREYQLRVGTFADSGNLASRATATVYQNTTGKCMFVAAQIGTVSAGSIVQGLSDAAPTPTNVVSDVTNVSGGTNTVTVFMIVPPGHYYKVTAATGSASLWHEYTWNIPVTKSNDLVLSTGTGATRSGVPRSIGAVSGSGNIATIQVHKIWINRFRMLWVVWISGCSNTTGQAQFLTDVGVPPFTFSAVKGQNSANQARTVSGPVNPLSFYLLLDGSGTGNLTQSHWWEYELG